MRIVECETQIPFFLLARTQPKQPATDHVRTLLTSTSSAISDSAILVHRIVIHIFCCPATTTGRIEPNIIATAHIATKLKRRVHEAIAKTSCITVANTLLVGLRGGTVRYPGTFSQSMSLLHGLLFDRSSSSRGNKHDGGQFEKYLAWSELCLGKDFLNVPGSS